MNLLEELDDFIKTRKNVQEVKRAMAAKMAIQKRPYKEICELLQVSKNFVSFCKKQVIFEGVEGLKLQYKTYQGYLSVEQKQEVIQWLQSRERWNLEEVQREIHNKYGVIYESLQSYYNLFNEAKISWKKSQKANPQENLIEVEATQEEIKKKLAIHQPDIESGKLTVYMIDECHLLWGDICSYLWGKTNMRVEIPLKNEKERQTYYGALNYFTKEFVVEKYPIANTENTEKFLNNLRSQTSAEKILIFWDRASYHRSQAFRDYLSQINQGLSEDEWLITCFYFAPHAPRQNPVEDIWLQTKNFVRKFYHLCKSFKIVKWLFEEFANHQVFDFPKIYEYATFSQPL